MPDFKKYKPYSIRLKDYDYSEPGDYFVTICTDDRKCIFGVIVDGNMILNNLGKIIEEEILKTMEIRKELDVDIFSIMPNHLHLIISLSDVYYDPVETNGRSSLQYGENKFCMKPKSVSSFVAGFKSAATKRINILRETPKQLVFQDGYHEHIIRNQQSYDEIYIYIQSNPQTWGRDRNNPKNL
ncbi:MAG: transposase [Patescibacteria group bacterium]|nr:transposase [Patescibacteria group bacterium]